VVALDFNSLNAALQMAHQLDPKQCRVKVGKELFTLCGPVVVERLQKMGFEVFLDLKFHDIPNTTANAVAVAAQLGVWMVNVHASGGRKMMEACVDKLSGFQNKPLLTAVTVLTSMGRSDLVEIGLNADPIKQVECLAQLAKACGLDGVVSSSKEVALLRHQCGKNFKLVTPGIRPASASLDDQVRVMTPLDAIRQGADYLVIGRPITRADKPADALSAIVSELSSDSM
jgi:orotidine-5'-phosphate decarboxylase